MNRMDRYELQPTRLARYDLLVLHGVLQRATGVTHYLAPETARDLSNAIAELLERRDAANVCDHGRDPGDPCIPCLHENGDTCSHGVTTGQLCPECRDNHAHEKADNQYHEQ